jgi:hypothetical protein
VDQKYLEETLITESIDPSVEEDLLPLPKGMSLDKSVFEFPKCQVSQTTFKIKDLVKETLEEACNPDATPFYAGRLLVTARNLVSLLFYPKFVNLIKKENYGKWHYRVFLTVVLIVP